MRKPATADAARGPGFAMTLVVVDVDLTAAELLQRSLAQVAQAVLNRVLLGFVLWPHPVTVHQLSLFRRAATLAADSPRTWMLALVASSRSCSVGAPVMLTAPCGIARLAERLVA